MQTVKNARTANGKTVTRAVKAKNRKTPTWDVRRYNFLKQKWEREGLRLTYDQAYQRAYGLRKRNPYTLLDVYFIPGRRPSNTHKTPSDNSTEISA
jgi:hypothetical protein